MKREMADDLSNLGWTAIQSRFTCFPKGQFSGDLIGVFSKVFGIAPDDQQTNLRENSTSLIGIIEDLKIRVSLEQKPDRIILQQVSALATSPGIPNVGSLEESIRRMEKFAKSLTSESIPIVRYAFGTVLVHEVDTPQTAYEMLGKILGIPFLDRKSMKDFLFRINTPSTISHGEDQIEINRISTWAAVQMNVAAAQDAANQTVLYQSNAIHVELDVSTPTFEGIKSDPLKWNKDGILSQLSEIVVGLPNNIFPSREGGTP